MPQLAGRPVPKVRKKNKNGTNLILLSPVRCHPCTSIKIRNVRLRKLSVLIVYAKIPLSSKYQPYVTAAYVASKYPGLTALAGTAYGAYKLYRLNKRYPYLKHSVPVALASAMAPTNYKKRKYVPVRQNVKRMKMSPKAVAAAKTAPVNATGKWNVRRVRYVPRRMKIRSYGKKNKNYSRSRYSKKYSKKNAISLRKDCYTKGSSSRLETGGIMTDPNCVTIGHTVPFQLVRRTFFMALIKKILDKVGVSMENPEAGIPVLTIGDAIYIYYRTSSSVTAGAPLEFHYTCLAGAESLATITTGLIAAYETAAIAGTYEDLQLERIFFYSNGVGDLASMQLSLVHCNVGFYFDSTLKLQNRTSDGIGNTQADDLVAQHVTGKSYYGYGNCSQSRIRNAVVGSLQQDLIGNAVGLMGATNWSTNANFDQWKEPLPKNHFQNVLTSHGLEFNPGQLKKSHLRYHCNMPINEFFKFIVRRWDRGVGAAQNLQPFIIKKGKFRFFMLEKEIETIGSDMSPATPVTIGYEVNHNVGVCVYPRNQTFLTREQFIERTIPSL